MTRPRVTKPRYDCSNTLITFYFLNVHILADYSTRNRINDKALRFDSLSDTKTEEFDLSEIYNYHALSLRLAR